MFWWFPKNWKNDKIEEIVLVSPTHRQLVLLGWPNVAIYYTVMIIDFQDEMLIFMEYCAHGTIADVAKLGLSEGMVRKYTADILGAVGVLHENGIVHRDIKGRLTHWGWDKMDAISLTTFSNEFSWMKMYEYRLKFHWSLFLRVQLTISQHWFR